MSEPSPSSTSSSAPPRVGSGFVFFGVVSAITLLVDICSKAWAEIVLTKTAVIDVLPGNLAFVLAYNKGGAWGLLQDQREIVRLPFFFAASALAITGILALFAKLPPEQRTLKWGLPLVLGGALGNLSDRIVRSSVVDFIDYRGDWVLAMNQAIAKVAKGWSTTDHWPTFNVADIAICVGIGLIAIEMFSSKRLAAPVATETPAS